MEKVGLLTNELLFHLLVEIELIASTGFSKSTVRRAIKLGHLESVILA